MGRKRIIYLAIGMMVSLGIVIGVVAFWPRAPQTLADADDPQIVELGRRIYAEHCASCHGEALEGQANWRERNAEGRLPAPPHDDSGHSWHHPDLVLFGIAKKGPAAFLGLDDYESDMPAFDGTISDAEIWAAIAFIKNTWSSSTRKRQDDINRRSGAE